MVGYTTAHPRVKPMSEACVEKDDERERGASEASKKRTIEESEASVCMFDGTNAKSGAGKKLQNSKNET